MTTLKDVLKNQPYPCFKVQRVPDPLKDRLKRGMLCLYNIDQKIFDFPMVGEIGPAGQLFNFLEFIGYYSIEDFRDLVFASRLPLTCPSCKGPVTDAGMLSYDLEEVGTAKLAFASGDAEVFVCEFCNRPFALMPID